MPDAWLIVVGAASAGFVQGLSGFGFGLVSMSFWAWGLEPRLALVLATVGGFSGQLLAAWRVRPGFDLPRLAPFLLGGLCGIPLGVWVLPHLDVLRLRACLGALLALWCPLMLLAPRLPPVRAGGRVGDALVGLLGGAMGPLGGFTGVWPSLWCTLRGMARDAQRAVMQNFNLTMLGLSTAALLVQGRIGAAEAAPLALAVVALAGPALWGMKVYARIDAQTFRGVVLVLLTLSGVVLLARSVPELLAR